MNRLLFVTGLYSKELEPVFIAQSRSKSIQNAPNVFQWALLSGLEENGMDYTVHSYPFLSSYPIRYKRLKVTGSAIIYKGREVGCSFPYLNGIGLKNYSIKRKVSKETKKWLLKDCEARNVVLVYSQLSYVLEPLIRLKKEFDFQLCVIVTDLIEDALNFPINRQLLKRLQLNIESKKQKKLFSKIDKYVLLSKHMEERIPESIGKSIVIEGIANSSHDNSIIRKSERSDIKSLLYTGSLHPFSGIKDLIEAFENTSNESYRLFICGIGSEEPYIIEQQKKDERIVFLGNISREKAVELQYSSSVLINPRKPNGGITKYSFPSKTMEYLSSGTPMIGYYLEGIPDEYKPFIKTPRNLSVEALTETIEEMLSFNASELKEKGNKALEFIKNNKTCSVQVKRILDFVFDE